MPRQQRAWAFLFLAFLIVSTGAFIITSQASSAESSVKLPWDTPPDYNIVYLTNSQESFQNSNAAPEKLEQALGAETVSTWQDITNRQDIDALVIHDSALSLINQDDLVRLYRDGVLVSFINVYGPEVARLVDDPCVAKDNFAVEMYEGEFYVMVYRSVEGQPEDVARFFAASDLCNETLNDIQSPLHIRSSRATESMTGADGFNIFANVLVSKLDYRKE